MATTLNNRLFALDTTVRNRGVIQNYGLVGPVVLTPYRQAAAYSSTSADGTVGGTVPATLALTLGAPGELRRVHAGRRRHLRREHDRERDLDGG